VSGNLMVLIETQCCVASGTGLCHGPIPHPEESYRVQCGVCVGVGVCVCVCVCGVCVMCGVCGVCVVYV